ncbi:PREDICTED: putative ribosome-binding factor A, mitochondrial-like [Elephantulus edwardii]|uniref:putative ribosome-binding factor A, mitochondrial-like n=1 Tax=Elephantulus edwardii TaxID=28737 RepID=UPI0003F0691F|nr:PREDICTED: putative ribosome-binding factor A, mitochondrial-like [Elephantulus edwardii]
MSPSILREAAAGSAKLSHAPRKKRSAPPRDPTVRTAGAPTHRPAPTPCGLVPTLLSTNRLRSALLRHHLSGLLVAQPKFARRSLTSRPAVATPLSSDAHFWRRRWSARRLILFHDVGAVCSSVSCGSKNLLKKFASKSKKKFWYDSPVLGSHLTYRPSKLESLVKTTSKKNRKEDHVRLRALNGLLYKALTDLLCTSDVSQEVYDLNVELSKVSLTSDFSACRVYWRTSLSVEQHEHAQAILQKSATHLRHLLISQQILRNVPPIIFVQDRGSTALAEIDQLLAVADFGPPDGKEEAIESDVRDSSDQQPLFGATQPAEHPRLCEIDHEALHKQIMEYKQKRERGLADMSQGLHDDSREQLAELARQMKRRKKKTKVPDDAASPKSFLLGMESEDRMDNEDLQWPHDGPEQTIQNGERWR